MKLELPLGDKNQSLPSFVDEVTYKGMVLTLEGLKYQRVTIDSLNDRIASVKDLPEPSDFEFKHLLTPGLVDLHVHYRGFEEAYKETIDSGSFHSMMTGVMFAYAMPNVKVKLPGDDKGKPLDNLERFLVYKKACERAYIPTKVRGMLSPSSTKEELARMHPECEGVFKAFMAESVGSGFFTDYQTLDKKVSLLPKGSELWLHCEDPKILEANKSKWNPLQVQTHYEARPTSAKVKAVGKAIELAEKYGDKRFVVCHVSTREELNELREAKKELSNIKVETCYHYLKFNIERLTKATFKCNPSLATSDDQDALFEGLLDGTIDYLSSDHAPHTRKDKLNFASGLPSYDSGAFGWLVNEGVRRFKNPNQYLGNLLRAASLNYKPEWEVKEGNPTRLLLLNMKEYPARVEDNYTKARNVSPWINEPLPRLELIIHRNLIIDNRIINK